MSRGISKEEAIIKTEAEVGAMRLVLCEVAINAPNLTLGNMRAGAKSEDLANAINSLPNLMRLYYGRSSGENLPEHKIDWKEPTPVLKELGDCINKLCVHVQVSFHAPLGDSYYKYANGSHPVRFHNFGTLKN